MRWIRQALSPLIGQSAEVKARDYLQKQGLTHIESNYRCQGGEIDLIMREREEWVFVEVKYRSSTGYGGASEQFHPHKRKKFTTALQYFLQQRRLNHTLVAHRIDVLAIDGERIQWQKHV